MKFYYFIKAIKKLFCPLPGKSKEVTILLGEREKKGFFQVLSVCVSIVPALLVELYMKVLKVTIVTLPVEMEVCMEKQAGKVSRIVMVAAVVVGAHLEC